MHETANGKWWDDATPYQIYVRSFADSNADGIGDLEGIRQHLDYIEWLGVDGIWLGPVYPSPMVDGGYDVADTMEIDPRFGDLATFDTLVSDIHRRKLRIIGDIIPNHLSNQHPWFREALAAGPDHPARQRFHFHHGTQPPNDWPSLFGGPAWTRTEDGEWHLHLFTPEQPDLNWNHPDVIALWDETLRFWLERGVDGFRINAATMLDKPAYHLLDEQVRAAAAHAATTP